MKKMKVINMVLEDISHEEDDNPISDDDGY